MTTTIAEYSKTDAALAVLRDRYADAQYDVTTGKGMAEAKAGRAELRGYRVDLEKMRVDIKAPALERCRQIDAEANRIKAELSALEDPIDATIKAEENRKAIEKAEKERQARAEQEAVNARFAEIKALPLAAVGATAESIREQIEEADLIDPATFPDALKASAQFEKHIAIASLRAALDRRLLQDEEDEKIKAERAELERMRAENERLQREAEERAKADERKAAAERAEADRLAQVERDRIAADERAQRAAEQAAKDEAARIEREEQQAALKAERDRQAADQRKLDEQAAKLKREKQAAAAKAEADRIASMSLLQAANDVVEWADKAGFSEVKEVCVLRVVLNRLLGESESITETLEANNASHQSRAKRRA